MPFESLSAAEHVQLLIVQASPFCNIDCDYCYLRSRSETRRIQIATVQHLIKSIFRNNLVREKLSVVWHAGEPLTLPLSFYESVFSAIRDIGLSEAQITHHIQTNGMLISDQWCEFIKQHGIRIGVSIDGPAELHDRHRKTRLGRGTHTQAMQGVEKLRAHGIPFHVIAVITPDSLSRVDEIFDFFDACGAYQVGFNIEEQEGIHTVSTLVSLAGQPSTGRDQKVLATVISTISRWRQTFWHQRVRQCVPFDRPGANNQRLLR